MDNRTEIREFLVSRRARITPQRAGRPVFGEHEAMELAADPGLSLLAYTAEPGSRPRTGSPCSP